MNNKRNGYSTSYSGRRLGALLLAVMLAVQLLPAGVAAEQVYSDPFTLREELAAQVTAAEIVTHTVTFKGQDGTVLQTLPDVPDGTLVSSAAQQVQVPDIPGFAFVRWLPNDKYVTQGATDFTAQYEPAQTYLLTIRYLYQNESQAAPPYTGVYAFGDTYSAESPPILGYELADASQQTISGVAGTAFDGAAALDYTVYYQVNTGTPYRVEHWFQAVEGPDYVRNDSMTQPLTATSGALVQVTSQEVTGFHALTPTRQVRVAPDGSTVVQLRYDRDVHVITYDTSGGTYIPPFTGRYGSTVPAVANPTRSGYAFSGWDITPPRTLVESLHITALWEPAPANYTVMYWLENANNKEYSFQESVVKSGLTGDLAVYDVMTYTGFHLDLDMTEKTTVYIQGDGSAVKNVYYGRDKYQVIFLDNNLNHVIRTYTGVKQGMVIWQIWNEMHNDFDQYTWYTATNNQEHYTFAPEMPAHDLYLYGNAKGSVPYTIYYIDNDVTDLYIRPPYAFTANSNVKLKSVDYVDFDGFDIVSTVNDGSQNAAENPPGSGMFEFRLYYKRLSYDLKYYNVNTYLNTSFTLKYDDPLQPSIHNITPAPPTGMEDYRFAGWYTSYDILPGTEFVWAGARMPAGDLILYASWLPPSYAVQFQVKLPDGTHTYLPAQNITEGDHAIRPEGPEAIPGYTFDGWYYPGTRTPYNFAARVYSGIMLEGSYQPSNDIVYTVRYLDAVTGDAVFPEKVVTGQTTGATVTEDALWPDNGLAPDLRQKSLKLAAQDNVITFYYAHGLKEYTVRYVEEGTNLELLPPAKASGIQAQSVTVTAAVIQDHPYRLPDGRLVYADFLPDNNEKTLLLTTTPSDNVLTFYYQRQIKYHYYVQYVEAGTGYVLAPERYVVTTHNNVVEHAPRLDYYLPASYQSTYPDANYSVSGNGAYVSSALYVTDPELQSAQIITFYYKTEKIAVTGTKTWVDEGNIHQTRPATLRLTLLEDGEAPTTQPPYTWTRDDANNTWHYTYLNMPAADQGEPFVYTVTEALPALYTARHHDRDSMDGTDITNTLEGGTTTYQGSKTWIDEKDPLTGFNPRPAALQVTILRKSVTDPDWVVMQPQPQIDWTYVTGGNPDVWSYTAQNLKLYEAGYPVAYMARETVPSGYRQTADEAGHFTNEVMYTTANLVWVNGPADERPTVWLTLYRQSANMAAAEPVPNASSKEMTTGTTQATWRGLAQLDTQNSPYTFTVRQTDITGLPLSLSDYATDESGLTVTNTYQIPEGSRTGTKEWVNGEFARPQALWLQLRRTFTTVEGTVDEAVPDAQIVSASTTQGTSHEWPDLDLTDSDGNVYTFYLQEGLLSGGVFTKSVPEHFRLSGEGTLNLVNTYQIPTDKSETAFKVWSLGSQADKPDLWFRLERRLQGSTGDFAPVPQADVLQVPNEAPFTVTWTGLERTNAAGQPYEFAVTEGTLTGNTFTAGAPAPFSEAAGQGTLQLTNTYKSPLRPNITATKLWTTTGTGPAPEAAVTLELWQQAGAAGTPEKAREVTLDGNVDAFEPAPYKGLFTNLPLTDEEGVTYLYTVREPNVPANYLATFNQEAFQVTNQWQTVSFTARKEWAGGYEGMTRPPVTFQLWRESAATEKVVVPGNGTVVLTGSETTPWTHTWQNLREKDDSNNAYAYTVEEIRLPGYTPSGPVTADDAHVITNTYEHVSVNATKVIVVPEGQTAPDKFANFTLLLSRNGEEYLWATLNGAADALPADGTHETEPTTDADGNPNWHYTWGYLPRFDENGDAYTYEVSEPNVPTGYVRQSVIEETPGNFVIANEYRRDTFRAFKYWNTRAGTGEITFQLMQQQLDAQGNPLSNVGPTYMAGRDIVLKGSADAIGAQYEEAPSTTPDGWPRWSAVWTGLSTTANGNTVKYFVREVHTPAFAGQYDTATSASTVITNTSLQTIITARKEWREGSTLTRPPTTLTLRRYMGNAQDAAFRLDGIVDGTPDSAGETTAWNYTWPPQTRHYFVDGTRMDYEYRVTEDTVPAGYTWTDTTVSADGTIHTLYNTYTPPTRTLSAAKVWQGGDADNRPAVTFLLERRFRDEPASQWAPANPDARGHTVDGVPDDGVNPLTGAEEYAPWKLRGAGLPATHIDGRVYEYRVRETAPVSGFETTYGGNMVVDGETMDFAVINTYTIPETGTETAVKKWAGGDMVTKPEVWLQLWRSKTIGSEAVNEAVPDVAPVNITAAANYTHTFNNLETTDFDANPYTFFVVEGTVNEQGEFTAAARFGAFEQDPATAGTLLPTNRYVIPTDGAASAAKTWVGGPAGNHTGISLTLYRQAAGQLAQPVPGTPMVAITPRANDPAVFDYAWSGLERTDAQGNPYTFFAREAGESNGVVTGADGISQYDVAYSENRGQNHTDITNTYRPPMNGRFVATKTWVNGPARLMLPVDLQLWRNAEGAEAEPVPAGEGMLLRTGEAPKFTYTWSNLQEKDLNGLDYTFHVVEAGAVDGLITYSGHTYQVTYDLLRKDVTNTYQVDMTRAVQAGKTWKDGPDTRPTIWLRLQRRIDSTAAWQPLPELGIKELINGVTTAGWTGLALTDNAGNPYDYSVQEGVLANNVFTPGPPNANYTVSGQDTLNLTNQYVPTRMDMTAHKEWRGGPAVKPTIWFKLQRSTDGETYVDVPGLEPQRLLTGSLNTTFLAVEQTALDGTPYLFRVVEGLYDGATGAFVPGLPAAEHYQSAPLPENRLGIVNTYVSPTTSKTGTKVWSGNGPTPYPVVYLQLQRRLSAQDAWMEVPGTVPQAVPQPENGFTEASVTWNDIDINSFDARPYTFQVVEGRYDGTTFTPAAPSNYIKSERDLRVSNSWQTTSRSVEIVWNGQQSPYYEQLDRAVTVTLYSTTENGETSIAGESITLTGEELNPWKHTWNSLPVYDDAYNLLTYTVEQENVPQSHELGERITIEGGWQLSNIFQGVSVAVQKIYQGSPIKPAINAVLIRNGAAYHTLPMDGQADTDQSINRPRERDNLGNAVWPDLPKLDEDGAPYAYTVTETIPTGDFPYVRNIVRRGENDFLITNTYSNGSLLGVKNWNLGGASRPAQVTFHLYREVSGYHMEKSLYQPMGPEFDGILKGEADAAPNASGETAPWEYTWRNLPLNGDLNDNPALPVTYRYFIRETVPDGFFIDAVSSGSLKITNVARAMPVTAVKTWGGEPNAAGVYLQLWRQDSAGNAVPAESPAFLNGTADAAGEQAPGTNTWSFTWQNQPRFALDAQGNPDINQPYTYYVTEVDAQGQPAVLAGYKVHREGPLHLVNVQHANRVATVHWEGGSVQRAAGIGPVTFLTLYRRTTAETAAEAQPVPAADLAGQSLTQAVALLPNAATVTWKDLPMATPQGLGYVYSVVLTDADGVKTDSWQDAQTPARFAYTATYTQDTPMAVTNTFSSPVKTVTASKTWYGAAENEVLPAIWFGLQRGINTDFSDQAAVTGVATLQVPENNIVTWENQPIYDGTGSPYLYTAAEFSSQDAAQPGAPAGWQNTPAGLDHVNVKLVNLTAEKVWAGLPAGTTGAQTRLQLKRGLDNEGGAVILTDDGTHRAAHTWHNLPAHAEDGTPYTYTAEEVAVPNGYTMARQGNTFTNTYDGVTNNQNPQDANNPREPVTIDIVKQWQDAEGNEPPQGAVLPNSLSVTLTRSDAAPHTLTLSGETGWAAQLANLPKYDTQGGIISYGVTELAPQGFTQFANLQDGNSFTLVNRYNTLWQAAVDVEKTADAASFQAAGDVLTFTVSITNTGDINLSGMIVEDTLADIAALAPEESNISDGVLEAGESWTYTYTYTVSTEDVTAGKVRNAVTVTLPGVAGPLGETGLEVPLVVPATPAPTTKPTSAPTAEPTQVPGPEPTPVPSMSPAPAAAPSPIPAPTARPATPVTNTRYISNLAEFFE